jgi:hypothetical protein
MISSVKKENRSLRNFTFKAKNQQPAQNFDVEKLMIANKIWD